MDEVRPRVEWTEAAEFCPEAASAGDMMRKSILSWITSATDRAIQSAATAAGCSLPVQTRLRLGWMGQLYPDFVPAAE
ncbi:MAG: hypothetical protein MUC60_18365 [Oscillatoria sp. Prado101]|nr:hypothetical protein [Oscillatoria sp. Prado101]